MVNDVHQGDVHWLDFGPLLGSGPAERHPCVVVQSDLFNRTRIATTVVCLIASQLRRAAAPGNVALKPGDAGLPKPSVVNVSQIFTVDKSLLEEQIGTLPKASLALVLKGLRLVLEEELP